MPKLESDFKVGGRVKFKVALGPVIKLTEELFTQAFESQKRWCWGNKILFKKFGYSQRCRWLQKIDPNKTLYMTTEKFKGAMAGMVNLTQRKILTKGVMNETRELKNLAEYEYQSQFFKREVKACNAEGDCIRPSKKRGRREIILTRTLDTTPENVFPWLYEIEKIQKWLGNFKTKVTGVAPNDPFGNGNVRRIVAPFVGITDETYTIIDDKKFHIRYRVTKSKYMKNHIGDMLLFRDGKNKTQFIWVISYDSLFKSPRFQRWFINNHLKGGLKKLKNHFIEAPLI
jgi:hypothetical protein